MRWIWIFALCINCPAIVCAQTLPATDPAAFDSADYRLGDNFFRYVNGNWIKSHPIPPQRSYWGVDVVLEDNITDSLHAMLTDLVNGPSPTDPEMRKLRDFDVAAMDEPALASQGLEPLKDEFQRLDRIDSTSQLLAELGHLHNMEINVFWNCMVQQDEKQSDRYAFHLSQGGVGLPEREYYLASDGDSVKMREEYRKYIVALLTLAGDSDALAAAGAQTVMKLETELAKASRTPEQLRDDEANYNKTSLTDFARAVPRLDFPVYFKALSEGSHPGEVPYLIVCQPEFFQQVNSMLASVSLADWKTYLRFHLLSDSANFLSLPFEKAHFHFYGEILSGIKEMDPRWKRVLHRSFSDGAMGEILGRLYVEKYFPPATKARAVAMVRNILDSYRDRIASRDWMSDETRKIALAKLAAITVKIGYPDHWRDFSSLEARPDSYLLNTFRSRVFEARYLLNKLNGPVDRSLWEMTPPTVNCYYEPTRNEIVFPAGFLQPPFFDAKADDATNYGAVGSVIGHEITHGFDDQGSKFTSAGNLKDWWTPDDRKKFNARTAKLVEQFNDCVAIGHIHIHGALTLGENIADLGGITISYYAYLKSLEGKTAPVVDGLTGPQRFFVSYARSWCNVRTDASLREQLRTDPHAPEEFRVLMPLSNLGPFYDAFHITPADKMYRKPEDRVEIW